MPPLKVALPVNPDVVVTARVPAADMLPLVVTELSCAIPDELILHQVAVIDPSGLRDICDPPPTPMFKSPA